MKLSNFPSSLLTVFPALLLAAMPIASTSAFELPPTVTENIEYRNLGPFRVNGWVTDFAVPGNGTEHATTIMWQPVVPVFGRRRITVAHSS